MTIAMSMADRRFGRRPDRRGAGAAACAAKARPRAMTRTASSITAEDIPTFKVAEDGTVDWYTFSGYRRYHAECHVCHGPDGQGSTYAPAIAKTVGAVDYYEFTDVVVNGRQNGNQVMPSFGTNKNVMCYLDDIYIYLKAVGSGAIPRGRPAKQRRQAGRPSPRPRMPAWARRRPARALAAALGTALPAAAQLTDLVSRTAFRVCADPANLPFSNEAGEGFENEIAELFAETLGRELQYTWFPMAQGFVRRTLVENRCDVIIGYAQGDELVLNTNHYYTSTHVLVTRADSDLADVDDARRPAAAGPRDRGDRGRAAGEPPGALRADGDGQGLRADGRPPASSARTRRCSPTCVAGGIDAAVMWGPIGGPLARDHGERWW